MANIHETISEIKKINPELAQQVQRYVKEHSYGLVFEQNLPDAVRLWTKKPAKGDKVNILPPRGAFDTEENNKVWYVIEIVDGMATLSDGQEIQMVSAEDIVPVVGHKDEIYPGLKVIDKVERGNADDPYHMVINAENYHALEALCYAYAGKVDCIYIDPPYNTGAKDWKYNNDYVGKDDQYRHSKWLAMMERRLKLAKKLLNPTDSVLIVTIDEKEYLRLGLLLEQLFPEARIQMIVDVIHPSGVARESQFSRVEEYIFYVAFGCAKPIPTVDSMLDFDMTGNYKNTSGSSITWRRMIRAGSNSLRRHSENCFYPIFVDVNANKIHSVGMPLGKGVSRDTVSVPDGCVAVFPIHTNGEEGVWQISRPKLLEALKNGTARLGKKNRFGSYAMNYLSEGMVKEIKMGHIKVLGKDSNGALILERSEDKRLPAKSVWNKKTHDATQYGSYLISDIFGKRFTYPKSLYSTHDAIKFYVADKPNAFILDFFAGSGTTLHSIALMNACDNGHRRCILVTNNEVGSIVANELIQKKLRPSDIEWKNYGIANYITWVRIKCVFEGHDCNGSPLSGDYGKPSKDIDLGFELPKSEGFKENAIFCELTYEDPWAIRLDHAFNAVAPILWMLAGCKGKIIEKLGKGYATTCHYAVLFKYDSINKLVEVLKNKPSIEHVFVVTDDQQRYLTIIKKLNMIKPQNIHRLYESYLRSFEIVGEGGLD